MTSQVGLNFQILISIGDKQGMVGWTVLFSFDIERDLSSQ